MKSALAMIAVLAGLAVPPPRMAEVPLSSATQAPGARDPSISVPFTLKKDGLVSVALYDTEGRMVRTLLTGAPRKAGRYTETWDGLDRYGRPVPGGEYTWKLVATEGLRAEFITQVGQNVDPPWERATGNHAPPNAVAVDATGLYRLGATNEGAHWGVKTDLNGRHLWTNDRWSADPWVQDTAAVALVKDRLFELMPNGHVYGYHATTGRVFTNDNCDPKPWNLRWENFQPPPNVKDDEKRKLNAAQSPRDIAGDGSNGLIVAAYPAHGAVAWYNATDGKRVDTAKGLPNLAGITVAKDGTVLAISQGAVVAFSREDKKPRTLISPDKLQSPWRLCVSGKSGDLFIAENSDSAKGTVEKPLPDVSDGKIPDLARGARITPAAGGRHHQVKRFSASGVLLNSFGRPEGRGDGPYVPTDFRGLTDIEADPEGGFVVTEGNHTPPRRSARFDANGRLLREWYGAQHYGVIACPEPGNPRFVWTLANAGQPGLVRWEVDCAAKSFRVAEVYQDVFAANRLARVPAVPLVFTHAGRIYIQGSPVQPTGMTLCLYDPAAKRIRPCNTCETREQGGKKQAYLWNDLNDDGLASDDEIEWLHRSKLGGYVNPADLMLVTTATASDYNPGPLLKPSRLTAGGTPVYSLAEASKYEPWSENGWKKHAGDIRQGTDGSWYGCFADGTSNPHEGAETHGAWYYNSCSAIDRLVKWSKDWKPLWSVGRHSPDNDHETGSTAMARGLVGLTHGCVVWADASDEETCRPTVWTEDGLYVDELLRVPIDQAPKEAYGMFNANEYPSGHLHTDARTGETFYYALNSGGGSPIYRISGWEGWHRDSGKVILPTPAAQGAKRDGTGLKAEYFNNPDCAGTPAFTRTDKLIYFNWGDGLREGVPDKKTITANLFSVRWSGTYEAATNADVRFEIRGSFPWRSKGQPLWSRLWLAGELVFDSRPPRAKGATTYEEQAASSMGTVRVKLRAGERIDLRLECGFKRGEAAIALNHDTPQLDRRAILPEFLHPEPGPKRRIEVSVDRRPEIIADFGFEEKDGSVSRSRAGVEIFGRLTGNAKRISGKVGSGIELEGRSEFDPGLFPIDEELRLPDTGYTVAFWFKTSSRNTRLCEARRYSSYNNRWSDHVVSIEQGKVRFQLQGDAVIEAKGTANDGQWHHVATTVGEGGEKLYVDGQLAGQGKLSRRTRASNRLGLDLGPGGHEAIVGMDELRVYGRMLSAEEVLKLHATTGK
jgi:hypothetical protein